jgi:hypothetical protein
MKFPVTPFTVPSMTNSLPARFNGMVAPSTFPWLSTIEFAMIETLSRTRGSFSGDGFPLAASVWADRNREIQQQKKPVKIFDNFMF